MGQPLGARTRRKAGRTARIASRDGSPTVKLPSHDHGSTSPALHRSTCRRGRRDRRRVRWRHQTAPDRRRVAGQTRGRAPDRTSTGRRHVPRGHARRRGSLDALHVDVQGSHSAVTITITSFDAERRNANFDVVLDEPSAASGRRAAPATGQAATSDGPGKWQAT